MQLDATGPENDHRDAKFKVLGKQIPDRQEELNGNGIPAVVQLDSRPPHVPEKSVAIALSEARRSGAKIPKKKSS